MADAFVIYCRIGFHYNNLKEVVKDPSIKLRRDLIGNEWIYHDRIKTGETAKVLSFWKEIAPIIEKYGGWHRLPILSNAKMNDYLKVIAAERRLPSNLSVKHGRTTLCN